MDAFQFRELTKQVAILLMLSCLLFTSLCQTIAQETPPPEKVASKPQFDVDKFFRESIVIDGTTNYYSTATGSEIGQPDFDQDRNGQSVKQATGIDIGGITIGSVESLVRETANLESGRYTGAMLIRTFADFEEAVEQKKYGIMFYTQKHPPLKGNVQSIQLLHDAGLRIFQLQYSENDPNQEPEERLGCGPRGTTGLTRLGEEVVHELIRVGMVVDLAHCNTQTTIDAARIAREYGIPITANHVGARNAKTADGRWLARYARNATDEKLVAVKKTGGVVGVMAYGPYLRGPYQQLRMTGPPSSIEPATVDDFVTHLDYMVKLIGIDHVGLCTDGYLDGTMAHERTADGILDSPGRWKAVVVRLHEMGYSESDLKKIVGLNFLRVYRKVFEYGEANRKQERN